MLYEEFKTRAEKLHSGKFSYPEWGGNRLSSQKVPVVCPVHGLFEQLINSHIHGKPKGCVKCGHDKLALERKDSFEGFTRKAEAVHGGIYAYPGGQEYRKQSEKVRIICPTHGEFTQSANSHLNGCGCPACGETKRNKSKRRGWDEFLRRAKAKHGDRFGYLGTEDFQGMKSKVRIVCPVHGEYTQVAEVHVRSPYSCPACSAEAGGARCRLSDTEILRRLEAAGVDEVWKFLRREGDRLYFHCSERFSRGGHEHGEFSMLVSNFGAGKGCAACARKRSKAEDQVRDFVRSLGFQVEKGSNKNVPGLGRYQLDVVIQDKKIAVEYNGVLWHSEKFKRNPRTAHLEKTELAESLGYRLIQIFEDEWVRRPEAVKQRLKAILGAGVPSIHARKTTVARLEWREVSDFLEVTHLQGCGVPASHCYALLYEGKMVAAATFGKARYDKGVDYELLRFAATVRVVGGAGKLLSAFRRDVPAGSSLISYADRRWSQGGVYKALGFTFDGYTRPNYSYTKGVRRFPREQFQKHRLASILKSFDNSLSEVVNCQRNGFYRIFDCGNSRWRLSL